MKIFFNVDFDDEPITINYTMCFEYYNPIDEEIYDYYNDYDVIQYYPDFSV